MTTLTLSYKNTVQKQQTMSLQALLEIAEIYHLMKC